MRRFHLVLWRSIATLTAVALSLGIAAFLFPQQILTVDSGDVKADVMIVLGGLAVDREERGAELFKAGAAPKILVSGIGDADSDVRLLEKFGVPANVITKEDRSTSTLENAEFSAPLLRQMGAHHVILVTTWYHSRRALACFEHFAPDITFYSRPSYCCYRRGEWNWLRISGSEKSEYLKLAGYWVWYGVRPYPL